MTAASAPPVLIAFESAHLGYGSKVVLQDVNMEVRAGDFLGIVGPNGAGKSTLLKAILGAIRPLAGRVRWESADRARRGSGIGYVPQVETVDLLYPLTAEEVVRMGAQGGRGWIRRLPQKDAPPAAEQARPAAERGRPGQEEVRLARRCLAQVGLEGLEGRLFRSLSGGQRQRTLLARALAAGSGLFLLDEPTAGMDLSSEKGVMDLIARLHREGGRTVLLVTHQLNLVANYARRIAVLKDGRVTHGEAAEILSDRTLTALYGVGVRVEHLHGRRVVVAP